MKYICKICGEEFEMNEDYEDFDAWFEEEGEEELWGHLQDAHEEEFDEAQNLDTPYMLEEYFELIEDEEE